MKPAGTLQRDIGGALEMFMLQEKVRSHGDSESYMGGERSGFGGFFLTKERSCGQGWGEGVRVRLGGTEHMALALQGVCTWDVSVSGRTVGVWNRETLIPSLTPFLKCYVLTCAQRGSFATWSCVPTHFPWVPILLLLIFI